MAVEARLRDLLDRELRAAHGLTLADYGVLVHLSESGPEGLRMSDLAELLVLSRSGLTRRVDSLERAGLVTRRACPADGRGAMAALTPCGRDRLAAAAPTHVAGVRRHLIGPIGDLGGLAAGLERIEATLGDRPAADRCGSSCDGGSEPGR